MGSDKGSKMARQWMVLPSGDTLSPSSCGPVPLASMDLVRSAIPCFIQSGASSATLGVPTLPASSRKGSAEWRRLYRAHPPQRVARDLLVLAIAWKIQEQAYGGLGRATKRRLADLASTMEEAGDLARHRVARLRPGAKLVREWQGAIHRVVVLEDGFEWNGAPWRSLSAIAWEITGAHWSGPRFFGLERAPKPFAEQSVA